MKHLGRTISAVVLTMLLGYLLLFLNGWQSADIRDQDNVQILRREEELDKLPSAFKQEPIDEEEAREEQPIPSNNESLDDLRVNNEFENQISGFKEVERPEQVELKKTTTTANEDTDAKYREDILRRIEGFRNEHTKNGRPEVFGLRGISWLYTNLNGMLLAAPDLERIFEERKVVGGKLNIEIRDVSGNPCNAAKANLVSIYTRIAGPEVMSALAEPVPGECKWIARYEVTVPGAYTILARLLHYNGMQDWGDECRPVQSGSELTETYVEVLHEIPRVHYAYTSPFICCTMCSRFLDCRYSLLQDKIRDQARWGWGSQCLLFKNSSSDNPNAVRADQVHARFNNARSKPLCHTKSRLDEYPNGTVWQLGCGRDQMLLRWAPCGSFGAPVNSSMQGTEDIVLFEHEHRDLLIEPSIDMPEWTMNLEQAQEESEAPIGDKRFKPVCDWSKLRIPDFEKGRWTRSPLSRYQSCGPVKPYFPTIWVAGPPYPQVDDPICALRFDLQNFNDEGWRNPPKEMMYRYVWRTELSDNYNITNRTLQNSPFVPGPWVGYYRLHPSSPCRMPPLRSANQIRQCFMDRNFTTFALRGDSIIGYLQQHMDPVFAAAFPNPKEYQLRRSPSSGANTISDMLFKSSNLTIDINSMTKALIADAVLAHLLFEMTIAATTRKLEENARSMGKGFNWKIWNTPPLILWEREPYLTAPRTRLARDIMRETFDKYGWYEVDYMTLGAAWMLDSTLERDALHVIGHAMVTFVQLMIDIICRAPI